jgi:putative flavoprotein involved in K+ transport
MDFGWSLAAEFDAQGYPLHQGGVTPEAGLHFVGLPWLTSRGSGFIPGVGEDAERIVGHIALRTRMACRLASGHGEPLLSDAIPVLGRICISAYLA